MDIENIKKSFPSGSNSLEDWRDLLEKIKTLKPEDWSKWLARNTKTHWGYFRMSNPRGWGPFWVLLHKTSLNMEDLIADSEKLVGGCSIAIVCSLIAEKAPLKEIGNVIDSGVEWDETMPNSILT